MIIPEINNDARQAIRADEGVAPSAVLVERQASEAESRTARAIEKPEETAGEEERSYDREEARKAAESYVNAAREDKKTQENKLQFKVDEDNSSVQVEVRDSNGKVIRKIPEDEVVKLAKTPGRAKPNLLDKLF